MRDTIESRGEKCKVISLEIPAIMVINEGGVRGGWLKLEKVVGSGGVATCAGRNVMRRALKRKVERSRRGLKVRNLRSESIKRGV